MFVEDKRQGEAVLKPSLDSFILWLETKDPDERYLWIDSMRCACAQYSEFLGRHWCEHDTDLAIYKKLNRLALGNGRADWTFGALRQRAIASRKPANRLLAWLERVFLGC